MKIALLGDIHGDLDWTLACLRTAKEAGAQLVCQVGDAGFPWPGAKKFKMADSLDKNCQRLGLNFLFIRGNHDSWDDLTALPVDPAEGFARLREHIWYLPDGAVAELSGVRIAGLGGASSIDRDWRYEQETKGRFPKWRTYYWPEEIVSRGATARLERVAHVDLLLTHEAPQQAYDEGLLSYREAESASYEADAKMDVELVSRTRGNLTPRLHAFGHHHTRVTSTDGTLIGLGRDGDRTGAMVLWDSKTGIVEDLTVKGR